MPLESHISLPLLFKHTWSRVKILPYKNNREKHLLTAALKQLVLGEMEKTSSASRHSNTGSGRAKKDSALPGKDRNNKHPKSAKLSEPHRKREREEERRGEQMISSSTVVNVDSVREHIAAERQEFWGLLESDGPGDALKKQYFGICELLLIISAVFVVMFFFPLTIWFCVKIVREHERAVIFRLGHQLQKKPKGPGVMFYLPILDVCHLVDIRLRVLKIPPHLVVTKDLVCTEVSAVCYYRVENVSVCLSSLAAMPDILLALAQVSVREKLAHHTFTDLLLDRKLLAQEIQAAVDSITCRWGIKVERAEIEEVNLPSELQHNFAVEAEAKRQAQVKVIAAEGEKVACEALKASVESISGSPLLVHLRLLQLLHSLRSEQPAVVLNISPDVLTQSIDLASLSKTLHPAVSAGDASEDAPRDSPMM